MARANRPTSGTNGHTNGHFNGKGRFAWPDGSGRDWRDVRDEMGPVSRGGGGSNGSGNGNGKGIAGKVGMNGHAGHANGGPHGQRLELPKIYLRPCDVVIDTPGQVAFAKALRTNRVIWGIASAGAGKTFLAIREAVDRHQTANKKIVLLRPGVEAGPPIGFLPGGADDKIKDYMAPMFEELGKFYGPADIKRLKAEGVIRTIPLQFLRGYNFTDCTVILDEAHNAHAGHIQLLLQRICSGTVVIILGDLERNDEDHPDGPVLKQSDLEPEDQGGLEYWVSKFLDIPGIVRVDMTPLDCHRDPLVKAMQARGL